MYVAFEKLVGFLFVKNRHRGGREPSTDSSLEHPRGLVTTRLHTAKSFKYMLEEKRSKGFVVDEIS